MRVTNIIVVLPKPEDANNLRNLLLRNGYSSVSVCTTGAQAISQADNLCEGIVISGYKMLDMLYDELHEYLPPGFDMLLLASQAHIQEGLKSNLMYLPMPLKIQDLLNTVNLMSESAERKRKIRKSLPKDRKPEEQAAINEAKRLLMGRNNMTEEEAHRYIQKCSMDSSTNMVETAQMVIAMMKMNT